MPAPRTVCLDPGHGGRKDTGAVYGSILEKALNLEVATIAKNYLEREGIKVIMTRYQDTEVSLETRCYLSNTMVADLFYSIHHNAVNGKAKGFEIYHYENSVNGKRAAELLASEFSKYQTKKYVGDKEMGGSVSEWNYFVLENTDAPAILSEFCYIDNPEDFKKYNPYTEAQCIARSILRYFNKPITFMDKVNINHVDLTDVSKWAKDAWIKAAVKGVNDGKDPKAPVTEEQLMVFFDRLKLLD